MKKKKIFIGIPLYRDNPLPEAEQTILNLFTYQDRSQLYSLRIEHYCKLRGSPNIYMQRYNLAQHFLKTDCDYFLYYDSDQVVYTPENWLDVLISDDVDIVSPLIVRRIFPHIPTCMTYAKKAGTVKESEFEDFRSYGNKTFAVLYSCGGICLIKREPIEAVKNPFYPKLNSNGDLMSTDYSFYQSAIDLGFKCFVNPKIDVGHIGNYAYRINDYYGLLDSGDLRQYKENDQTIYELEGA